MTKERLKNLKAILAEIEAIEEELRNLPGTLDTVTGTSPTFPPIKRTYLISGIDVKRGSTLERRLQRRQQKLQDEIEEMEEWLESLEDNEIITILRLRYRNGLPWNQVAASMGYGYSGESVKKIEQRFFKKLETCPQCPDLEV